MAIHFGLLALIVNVDTALFYGDLEEDIYMECTQGMLDIDKDDYIILNKCIYILVQAARYKKAVEILKKLGFIGGNVDPYIYEKRAKKA